MNRDSSKEISFSNKKQKPKKFIKDIVTGTLERSELIEETINVNLSNDIDLIKTDKD